MLNEREKESYTIVFFTENFQAKDVSFVSRKQRIWGYEPQPPEFQFELN